MGDGRHYTKLPGPCENEEKRHKPQVCKSRKKEKAPHINPTVVSLLFGIIFVSIFLNRDLDTALVAGGAGGDGGEEVGDVVLSRGLALNSKQSLEQKLTQG